MNKNVQSPLQSHRGSKKIGWVLMFLLLCTSIFTVRSISAPPLPAHAATQTSLSSILARNTGVFTSPPGNIPTETGLTDGALMGNGDMTTVVGGNPEAESYYVSKSDFWTDQGPNFHVVHLPVGGVTVNIPSLVGAGYNMQQDIGNAEVRSTFTRNGTTISMRAWTSATKNLLSVDLSSSAGSAATAISVKTWTKTPDAGDPVLPTSAGVLNGNNGTMWATRQTLQTGRWISRAAIATRILGTTYTTSTNGSATATGSFTLAPGSTVTIVSALAGGKNSTTYLSDAQTSVASLTSSSDASLNTTHKAWWQSFWAKSYIDLGGGAVERYWYGSLYALASDNRAGTIAPDTNGGFEATDHTQWVNNWHTNYNVESPYYGVYSSNHPELAASYYDGMSSYIPQGESNASAAGYSGVYYPVGIGPWGTTSESSYYGQKGDAAYLALNYITHWYYTLDTTWLQQTGYPYLIQVANFWDNYLTKNSSGKYVINNSAQNEGSSYVTNPIGDLAFVKYLDQALIPMSQALNVDASRRAKWQDIVTNLSPFPTFTNNGHTDFKSTQDAPGFYSSDANPVNAIFPGNEVGLGSSASDRQTAQNTIYDLNAWYQGNSFAWIFPAAARAGLSDTYTRFAAYLNSGLRANDTVAQSGGGIETVGSIETVDTMLLDSYDGTLRLFADWPTSLNASFTNLLARGAFTVSSSIASGVVQSTTITSEKGGTATVQNPWSAGSLKVIDTTAGNASVTTTTNGNLVSFATTSGHTYQLSGNSNTRINLALSATPSASSSHEGSGWSTAYINDNSLSTGWSSGDANTGSNHTEWVQVDLKSAQPFNEVDLYPRSDGANAGYGFPIDFTIAVSNNGSTWTTVVTKTGYSLPSGVQSFTFASQTARYVRVTGTNLRPNPNDTNQYRMQFMEFGVY